MVLTSHGVTHGVLNCVLVHILKPQTVTKLAVLASSTLVIIF